MVTRDHENAILSALHYLPAAVPDGRLKPSSPRIKIFDRASGYPFLEIVYRQALETLQSCRSSDDEDMLALRGHIACQIGSQGGYAEAEAELRALYQIHRRPELLGEEHPGTFTARVGLAYPIGKQGRHAEAEAEFRAIYEIERRPEIFGEVNPDTRRTRYYLARTRDAQSRHGEADDLLDGLEAQIVNSPGEAHPWVVELREYLASRRGP